MTPNQRLQVGSTLPKKAIEGNASLTMADSILSFVFLCFFFPLYKIHLKHVKNTIKVDSLKHTGRTNHIQQLGNSKKINKQETIRNSTT